MLGKPLGFHWSEYLLTSTTDRSHYSSATNMAEQLMTISPATNKPVLYRDASSPSETALLPRKAEQAFEDYRTTLLRHRQNIVAKALDILNSRQDVLAKELTEQMGRPISYTAKEITTAVARGRYLVKISDDALKDTPGEAEPGFKRYIKKVPIGPVLILFAWNVGTAQPFPKSTAENSLVSLPDSGQLLDTSAPSRKFCDTQSLPSDSYNC